jgi:hypothetical protein
MPGYIPKAVLTPFPPAITEAAARAASAIYEREYIVHSLTGLSGYLVDMDDLTKIFGPSKHDPFRPSLKTLYDRLYAGYPTISPLPGMAKDTSQLRKTLTIRTRKPVSFRPLEDFEDLYYASLARMQDMTQTLNVRLASGFNKVTDKLFDNGPTIAEMHATLTEHWGIMNDPSLVCALDCAVRQSRVNKLYEAITTELEANVITQDDADELFTDLYNSKDKAEGLAWIAAWSPAMIGAWLEEKYRVLMHVEKKEQKRQHDRYNKEMQRRSRLAKTRVTKSTKSTRSLRSPIRRSSLEKMVQEVEAELAKLEVDDHSEDFKHGPAQQIRFVQHFEKAMRLDDEPVHKDTRMEVNQQVNKETRTEMNQQTQGPRAIEQKQIGQVVPRGVDEWQLKTRRVSEYSNYLRSVASPNARSIMNGAAYQNAVRATYQGKFDGYTAEDEMEL